MALKRIVTHAGTGTEIVEEILGRLGARLFVIRSAKEFERANPDGVILLGGCDIGPVLYGQSPTHTHATNPARDAVEWRMARHALDAGLPIMGICRGHQMLAVACGASLHQDMGRNGASTHHPNRHTLKVQPVLADHMPARFHQVNSYHHQAVKRAPFGFFPVAWAPDGIIEGIWRPGYLGVQFHPELMYPSDKSWIRLFEWFVRDGLLDKS
jgi:putative glutamine amidotransferase